MTGKKLLQQEPGPSTYVDDDYYRRLHEIAQDWSNPGPPVAPELHHEITALLNRECRLLDDGRFEEWLDLFQNQCIYWIPVIRRPTTRDAPSPGRYRTGAAWRTRSPGSAPALPFRSYRPPVPGTA